MSGTPETTLPPVTRETATRMANGERRSTVLRRANHNNIRHDLIDRFEKFENDVEALDADIRLPDKFRDQQREKLRTEVIADLERLDIDVDQRAFLKVKDKETLAMDDAKQSPGDLTGARAFLESVNDVQTIVDYAEEQLAIGYAPRLWKLLPMIRTAWHQSRRERAIKPSRRRFAASSVRLMTGARSTRHPPADAGGSRGARSDRQRVGRFIRRQHATFGTSIRRDRHERERQHRRRFVSAVFGAAVEVFDASPKLGARDVSARRRRSTKHPADSALEDDRQKLHVDRAGRDLASGSLNGRWIELVE